MSYINKLMYNNYLIMVLLSSLILGNNAGRPSPIHTADPFKMNGTAKIGDNPFPTNPMSDRARGYLLQGKAQTAITNYGNYIDIEMAHGENMHTYTRSRSLRVYLDTRLHQTIPGPTSRRSMIMMGYPSTAFGNPRMRMMPGSRIEIRTLSVLSSMQRMTWTL